MTFYVDGVAEDTWKATVVSLGSPLYIGADVQGKTLDGAVDEVYVARTRWTPGRSACSTASSARRRRPCPRLFRRPCPRGFDASAEPSADDRPTGLPTTARPTALPSIAPTVSPAPTSHWFQGSLIAYYDFADGTTHDIYQGWDGTPETMATTEGRDGGSAIALDHGAAVTLPPEATQDVLGDADRTVCLWARIDEWKGGCLFYYGGDGSQGTSTRATRAVRVTLPGRAHQRRNSKDECGTCSSQSECSWRRLVVAQDRMRPPGRVSYSYSYCTAVRGVRQRRLLAGSYSYSYSAETATNPCDSCSACYITGSCASNDETQKDECGTCTSQSGA